MNTPTKPLAHSIAALLACFAFAGLAAHGATARDREKSKIKSALKEGVVIGQPVTISGFETGTYWWAHLDVSPSKPGTLMVCGARTIPNRNATEGYIYLSSDYGKTWRQVLVDASTDWVSEESCAFGADDDAYFLSSSSDMFHGLAHHNLGRSRLYVSQDGGADWRVVDEMPFVDYSSLCAARIGGAERHPIYVFANDINVADPNSGPGLLTIGHGGTAGHVLYCALLEHNGKHGRLFSATPTESLVLENGMPASIFRVSRSPQAGPRPWARTEGISQLIEFVRSDDHGQTVDSPIPVSAPMGFSDLSEATMAVDGSGGPHDGRVYAAWAQNATANIVIVLAWSDNFGQSWQDRIAEVLPDAPRALGLGSYPGLTPPAVAVNKEGAVALFWVERNGCCPYFSESWHGGEQFEKKVSVGGCEPSSSRDLGWYAQYLFAWPASEANEQGLKRDERRVGVRIEMRVQSLTPTSMVADDRGNFHPMWLALRQGGSQLWTATIASSSRPRIPQTVSGRLVDVSSSVALEFTNTQFDARRRIFSVDVAVVNRGTRALNGPFLLEPTRVQSSLGPVSQISGSAETELACGARPAACLIPCAILAPEGKTSSVRVSIVLRRLKRTNDGAIDIFLRVWGHRS